MAIIPRRWSLVSLLIIACPAWLTAQSLVSEALASFPQDTIRIEYSHPSVLRALPDYAALRLRYEGPRLQELEGSLAKLGIQESDVDELVLGWRIQNETWQFFGITSGRFNARSLAERAASQGVAESRLGEMTAYCLGGDTNCVAVLSDSLGAFGTLASLQALQESRAGRLPNLGSDAKFAKQVAKAPTGAPIWGVAVGLAVPDWFRGWMPNQTDLKIDWAQAFKPVEGLVYSVDPGKTVKLNIVMDCTRQADAASLKQALDGLRLYQQLAWQNQNPGRPNPYQSLQIQGQVTQVLIQLETAYSDLMAPGTVGTSAN
jgi:hypothetical protein